ncbi:hypothetical protein [Bartonella rattimassiliensis]|uniref:Uncharacterized protein n=2 Tax=Bartonella rattimassiliensis TaxID=270250 RepID=J0QXF0_9HYPH|nr:hypothetical protein [Bartonella rattimassiliensis]EJF87849.1 hypothetical protein MCY_00052 [Bartonella rattimassiliensis 15908]
MWIRFAVKIDYQIVVLHLIVLSDSAFFTVLKHFSTAYLLEKYLGCVMSKIAVIVD